MFYWKKLSLLVVSLCFTAHFVIGADSLTKPENPERFQYLLDYAKDCRTIYLPDDWIFRQYPKAYVKTLPKSGLKFMILRRKDPDVQRIVFRGTSSWSQLFLGFKFFRDDETAEVEMHKGFLSVTKEFLAAELKNLDKDVPVVLTGHSMGGAVSILSGMFLHRMGFTIQKIVTFGQPRVTDRAGAEHFNKTLPITRIQHTTDIVPHMPPTLIGYSHFGELISMYGPFDFDYYDGKDKITPRFVDNEEEKKAQELWNKVQNKEIQLEDIPKPTAFPGSKFFKVLGRHGMNFYIRSMISNFGVSSERDLYPDIDARKMEEAGNRGNHDHQ